MSVTLTKEQDLMVRSMAYGKLGGAEDTFVTAVVARLDVLAAQGIGITRNHVRSAATAELAK